MTGKRRACDQCLGTDTQYECERGQCYAEWSRWNEEQRREAEREDYYRYDEGDQ